jgi:hypothetical protein
MTPSFRKTLIIAPKENQTIQPKDSIQYTVFKPGFEIVKL